MCVDVDAVDAGIQHHHRQPQNEVNHHKADDTKDVGCRAKLRLRIITDFHWREAHWKNYENGQCSDNPNDEQWVELVLHRF